MEVLQRLVIVKKAVPNRSIESETTTLAEEGSYSDASEESEEQEVVDVVPVTCELCGQAPCDWETFREEIWKECNGLKEQGVENKAIQFHVYKLYKRMRHDILRHFDRRHLPVCVRGEILGSWPDSNHSYAGFQLAVKDVSDNN